MVDNQHHTTLRTAPADQPSGTRWVRRLAVGAAYGALATVAMSVPMLAGAVSGISPMPKPIPAALVAHTLGPLPMPLLLVLAVIAHLAYGSGAGAVLAAITRRPRLWLATGHAVLLWVLMGLVWLPYLGWGLFGTAITPKIAAATLLLHLIYGATVGLLLRRRSR
jgi:hypothetical protein